MKTIKLLIVTAILVCGIIASAHSTTKKVATNETVITITDPGVGGGGS